LQNPLFSSLRLNDGPVFAHELEDIGSVPEHVVLSACELGVATIRPGDEPLGLSSVLLQRGTRSVVAGVAAVGDDVACDVMVRYHDGLAGGHDSARALADALREVPLDTPAPFTCFGAAWAPAG
jgi:CHAT domain-containing protein